MSIPCLITLGAVMTSTTTCTLSGNVTTTDGSSHAGLTVTFHSDTVSGADGQTTTTLTDGTFSLTVTTAGAQGWVGGETTDGAGNSSQLDQVWVGAGAPPCEIENFRASEGENGNWTFTGKVVCNDGSSVNQLIVKFTSEAVQEINNETCETANDGTGNFTFTIRIDRSHHGFVYAKTTNFSGADSNEAADYVDPT